MKKATGILIEQSDMFHGRLILFRRKYFSNFQLQLNKGKYEFWYNDSLMAEINVLPLDDNKLEVQIPCPYSGDMSFCQTLCDWIIYVYGDKWRFSSPLEKVKFYAGGASQLILEGLLVDQQINNPQDETIWRYFADVASEELPKSPAAEKDARGLAGGDKPPKPETGAPRDDWFHWYHIVTDELNYQMTLKELASEMGLSHNYVRQLHAQYMAQFRTET